MTREDAQKIQNALEAKGIVIEEGLSDVEVANIESKINTIFPPDLKTFLSVGLPASERFPDWRGFANIDLEAPIKGALFDVEHSSFWYKKWPVKPQSLQEALGIAKSELLRVPKLIPVYSHRYIPAQPSEEGNPIFSVVQTDIIYYGTNLGSYFDLEFGLGLDLPVSEIKRIEFWSDIVDGEHEGGL